MSSETFARGMKQVVEKKNLNLILKLVNKLASVFAGSGVQKNCLNFCHNSHIQKIMIETLKEEFNLK